MRLIIIIPTLNEAATIAECLLRLQTLQKKNATEHAVIVSVIVVDGGSTDHTAEIATPLADRCITTTAGRAVQMNEGAKISKAVSNVSLADDVLLFLHADTVLPPDAARLILNSLADSKRQWGRFDVMISGDRFMMRVVAWFMNHRSRITGIATGDQAIFMTRAAFEKVDGFPNQALMEDVEITSRLKKISAPICLRERVITSGRRWEKQGVWRTIFIMWWLRLRYFFGTAPAELHRIYNGK